MRYSVRAVVPAVETPASEGEVELPLDLLLLDEGTGLRGVFSALVRSAPSQAWPEPTVFRRAAEEVLTQARAPDRWASSLAEFLRLHSHHVPAAGADAYVEEAVRAAGAAVWEGRLSRPVFDLCTGKVVHIGELSPLRECFAAAVANAGDLRLDTRFVETWRAEASIDGQGLELLVRLLSLIQRHRLSLLSLEMVRGTFEVEFECTLRQWFGAFERSGSPTSVAERTAGLLSSSLGLRDASDTVLARVEELQREYEAAVSPPASAA